MRFRILFIANLFLLSLLVWPPGGSLLEFRQATYDMLLRMTAAIWIWVALVLASEYHLLRFLHQRRDPAAGAGRSAGAQSPGWREGAPADRRGGPCPRGCPTAGPAGTAAPGGGASGTTRLYPQNRLRAAGA